MVTEDYYKRLLQELREERKNIDTVIKYFESKITPKQNQLSFIEQEPRKGDLIAVTSNRFARLTSTKASVKILEETHTPMKVAEIYEKLIDGGFKFKSKNPKNSLSTTLRRNKSFKLMGVGYFGLADWKEQ